MSAPAINTRTSSRAAAAPSIVESAPKNQSLAPVTGKASDTSIPILAADPTPAESMAKGLEKIEAKIIKAPNLHQFLTGKLLNLSKEQNVDYVTQLLITEKINKMIQAADKDDSDDLKVKIRFENIVKDSIQEVTMKRLDVLIGQMNKYVDESDKLIKKAQILNLSEKVAFLKELATHEENLNKSTVTVTNIKDQVKSILDDLNLLQAFAAEAQIKLRDDFTSKWNSLCLMNYRLKLELHLIKHEICLLPELTDYFQRIQTIFGKVTTDKHNWETKGDWTGLDEFYAQKLKEFDDLSKEGSSFYNGFEEFVNKELKQEVSFKEEFLLGYAIHNSEVKDKVKSEMFTIIRDVNANRKLLWFSLFNQMELIYKELCSLGNQIDHIKTMNSMGITIPKSVALLGNYLLQFYATKVVPSFTLNYALKPSK